MREPETAAPVRHGPGILAVAVYLMVNIGVLVLAALSLAGNLDTAHSATPAADGAISTLEVVLALLLVNGGILASVDQTRRVGLGMILGSVGGVGVAMVVSFYFIFTQIGS